MLRQKNYERDPNCLLCGELFVIQTSQLNKINFPVSCNSNINRLCIYTNIWFAVVVVTLIIANIIPSSYSLVLSASNLPPPFFILSSLSCFATTTVSLQIPPNDFLFYISLLLLFLMSSIKKSKVDLVSDSQNVMHQNISHVVYKVVFWQSWNVSMSIFVFRNTTLSWTEWLKAKADSLYITCTTSWKRGELIIHFSGNMAGRAQPYTV